MADFPKHNRLLAALDAAEWERWQADLVPCEMPLGQVLYESGSIMSHVYFPTTAIVSLLYVMEDGASAEIAVVGNEGLVGVSLFMGGGSTPSRAVVQSAGTGYRLRASVLQKEFLRSGPVMNLLLRYTQALITQMAQTAVCNRHHSLDQQLCRWLLLSLDRLQGDELLMTQELIANMLGVRRGGVTDAAMKLQEAGLIRYSRGRIHVLDRAGLEERSCECYAVVKKEYDRLLEGRPQASHYAGGQGVENVPDGRGAPGSERRSMTQLLVNEWRTAAKVATAAEHAVAEAYLRYFSNRGDEPDQSQKDDVKRKRQIADDLYWVVLQSDTPRP